jgi:hypothetical protein
MLVFSVSFFVIGFFKPVFMPLAYLACLFGKLPYYYPVLVDYRYEPIIAVVGMGRTFGVKDAFSRLKFSYNKYLYIFLITILISFSVAWDQRYSWDITIYAFVGVIMTYIMVLCSIRNLKDLKIFIWSFIVLYTFITYEPIYYYFIGEMSKEYFGEIVRAKSGLLEGHRGLANNMNQMIPIAFFLMLTVKNKLQKISSGIPLIFFISALILGKARIGVMGFMFFILLLIYYSDQRMKYGLFGGITIVILMLFSLGFSSTASRINIEEIIDSQGGFIHGIEMIRVFGNILGVGPGCFDIARGFYFEHTLTSHNLYGELLGELGIPGTIAWFFLIRQVYNNLKHSISIIKPKVNKNNFLMNLSLGLLISLLVRLFIGLASHSLYILHWYLVAALSIIIFTLAEKQEYEI